MELNISFLTINIEDSNCFKNIFFLEISGHTGKVKLLQENITALLKQAYHTFVHYDL